MKKILLGLSSIIVVLSLIFLFTVHALSNKLYNVAFNPDYTVGFEERDRLEVVSIQENTVELKIVQDTWSRAVTSALYSLKSDNGVLFLGDVLSIDTRGGDVHVMREIKDKVGEVNVGETLLLDEYYYFRDPISDLGIPYQEIKLKNELGEFDAWHVNGTSNQWVIYVHGLSGRKQVILKMLKELHAAKYNVLVFNYRNDQGAPRDPLGIRQMGMTEWKECEMAVRYALNQGAQSISLFGVSLGGAIAMRFMENSPLADKINGLIFDCPVVDFSESVLLNGIARYGEGVRYLLGTVLWNVARRLNIDWANFDVTNLFEGTQLPTLILHTEKDEWVPIHTSRSMANKNPLIELEAFQIGNHIDGWNGDTTRYEKSVMDFLASVVSPVVP